MRWCREKRVGGDEKDQKLLENAPSLERVASKEQTQFPNCATTEDLKECVYNIKEWRAKGADALTIP